MRHNKKIISLVVSVAMLITMLSSLVFVNAAETPEVYTKVVSSDETGVKIEIGFSNFAEEYATKLVGNTTVKVNVPEGITVNGITLGDNFAGATENVSGADATVNDTKQIIVMKVDGTGAGYTIGTSGVIATVDCAVAEAPTVTTDYTFEVAEFKCTDLDMASITLKKGDVTANNSTYTVEVEQVIEGPIVYVSDASVADGKVTVDIGYKQFAEEYATKLVGNTTVKVNVPEGFTVDGITLGDNFAGATENVSGADATVNDTKQIIVMKVDGTGAGYTIGTEGVIATVTMTAPADFADKVNMEVAEFKCTDLDMASITLKKGDVTAVAGKITVESDTPVDPTPTPTPPVEEDPEEVPAFETEVVPAEKTIAGGKVTVFTATVAPAAGTTAEAVTALLVDDEYQVIFDGKTSKGYAAGWAIATVSKADLIDAITSGTPVVNAEISIGGADVVTVSVLDSEGNTVVLAAE